MDFRPVVLNYDIVKSSKDSNLLVVEPSATVKMDKLCTYIDRADVMHAFKYFFITW